MRANNRGSVVNGRWNILIPLVALAMTPACLGGQIDDSVPPPNRDGGDSGDQNSGDSSAGDSGDQNSGDSLVGDSQNSGDSLAGDSQISGDSPAGDGGDQVSGDSGGNTGDDTQMGDGNPGDDAVEVLWSENFDDFPVTTTADATVPTGIPNQDLADHLLRHESLGSDDGNDPTKADNADIVSFDGSNALKSWYLDGQCCTGSAGDVGVADGGTGIDVRAYITSISTHYSEAYLSWNMYIDPDFVNPEGFKTPSLAVQKGLPTPNGRIMITDWTTNLDPQYYNWAHWTSSASPTWGDINYVANARTGDWITPGRWINFTLRLYVGTSRGVDGLAELFIDGIFINYTRAAIPFRDTDTPPGWSYIEISTFMGGNSEAYTSPRDQWMYYDDMVVWRFRPGGTSIEGSTHSGDNRDISNLMPAEANFGR